MDKVGLRNESRKNIFGAFKSLRTSTYLMPLEVCKAFPPFVSEKYCSRVKVEQT